jgi:hypothetical protein
MASAPAEVRVFPEAAQPGEAPLGEVLQGEGGRWVFYCAGCEHTSFMVPRRVMTYRHQGRAARALREHALWCRAAVQGQASA